MAALSVRSFSSSFRQKGRAVCFWQNGVVCLISSSQLPADPLVGVVRNNTRVQEIAPACLHVPLGIWASNIRWLQQGNLHHVPKLLARQTRWSSLRIQIFVRDYLLAIQYTNLLSDVAAVGRTKGSLLKAFSSHRIS
jgi:hypothetical protein